MHLTELEIASFIDKKSSKKNRSKVLKHLSVCEDCYNSFAEVYEIINEYKTKVPVAFNTQYLSKAYNLVPNKKDTSHFIERKNFFLIKKYALAFTVVAFIFSLTFFENKLNSDHENYRIVENSSALHLFLPEDLSTINSNKIIFRWQTIQKSNYYQLRLYDSIGNTIWSKSTKNIHLELPKNIKLIRHTDYLWQVTAVLENGEKISSNLHAFNYKE